MNENEKRALFQVCAAAAFADGAKVERERDEIRRIVEAIGGTDSSLTIAAQDILLGRTKLSSIVENIATPEARRHAYEIAVCVCDADGVQSPAERKFLDELRQGLGLDVVASANFARDADTVAAQPMASSPPISDAEVDSAILNTAILCAALEQLPQRLATMAIVPLQMRLVYKVGAKYGFSLDRGHVVDLLGAAGIGMASQLVDSFARQLMSKVAGRFVGSFLTGLAGRATGSAVAFTTTYALGQLAKRYYSGGRKLTTDQLRDTFRSLVDDARGVESKYAGAITERARNVNLSDLASLVRSS